MCVKLASTCAEYVLRSKQFEGLQSDLNRSSSVTRPSELASTARRRGIAFGLTLLIVVMPAGSARSGDHVREFVPEVNAFVKLSDQTRLFLQGDVTQNLTTNQTQGELGAHLDFTLKPVLRPRLRDADWVRDRYLWARVGYAVLSSPDKQGKGPEESRGILELTGRVPLPNDVWLVNRGRVDLRDIQGHSSQRYRLRFGIEREFSVGGVVIVPYGQAEVSYDTRYDVWNRQLYQFGAEVELAKQWRVEPYYARQHDSRSTVERVDRLGFVIKYYH